jgi:hypothetical protein
MFLRLELAAKESGDRSKEGNTCKLHNIYVKDCTKKLSRSCRCCLLLLHHLKTLIIIYISSTLLLVFKSSITPSTMRFSRLVVSLFLVLFYYLIFVSHGKSDSTEMLVGSAQTSVNVVISLSLSL